MAKAATHATPEYLPATVRETIGSSRIRDLPDLDIVALTCLLGPSIDPGDDKRYGPTWAAKDPEGNVWSLCTRLGTWQLMARGVHWPSKPLVSATNRFIEHVLQHCKESR